MQQARMESADLFGQIGARFVAALIHAIWVALFSRRESTLLGVPEPRPLTYGCRHYLHNTEGEANFPRPPDS
jgi:hypothetical protein